MSIKEAYNILYNVNYGFSDDYGLSFLIPSKHNMIQESLSFLRREKELTGHEFHVISKIFRHHKDNYYKIKYLISIEPRKIAQKFIGKKKIRDFIFKRDNYKCLKCDSDFILTIDHIMPISKGGENKLSNLQTLCKSCNCRKWDNFRDYR